MDRLHDEVHRPKAAEFWALGVEPRGPAASGLTRCSKYSDSAHFDHLARGRWGVIGLEEQRDPTAFIRWRKVQDLIRWLD